MLIEFRTSSSQVARKASIAATLTAIALLAAPAVANVTHYYKWEQPNGTTAFSWQKPPSSATRYEERIIVTPDRTPAEQRALAEQLANDQRNFTSPDLPGQDFVTAAQRALNEAERARAAGQAPLPGERQRLMNGHSRLAPSYFERQQRLDDAIAQAEADLRDATDESE